MHRLIIAILFNLLNLSKSVNDEEHFVEVQIPCQANAEQGLQYRKITWYKVEEGSEVLTGLVMEDLRTHVTVLYRYANQSYKVGPDYALIVPETGEKDCGRYRCTLWPPVGHYIQNGDYEYYPPGCSKRPQQCETVPVLCTGTFTVHFSEATEEPVIITSGCNQDITLPCACTTYNHTYMSITWYKVHESGPEGIIRRSQRDLKTDTYPDYQSVASLTVKNSLVLKNVTVKHTGLYKCSVIAKVGGKNAHTLVMLNVSECVPVTAPAWILSVLDAQSTEMQYTVMALINPKKVTALWVFVGFSTFGMAKLILCALCLWVVVVFKNHRRRKLWDLKNP